MPAEPSWWYQRPGLAARVLSPVAAIYGAFSARRLGRDPVMISKLPVICIGNFTAGGAGKTPASAMIVKRLVAMGRSPAILTRGYGGRQRGPHWVTADDHAADVGDEPLLHAKHAPVMVAKDRVAGARAIEADARADVIVMDDGLQNPSLAKTLSVAVVDGARAFGNGHVIPAGPLRAPLERQLAHVDAIVFNGPATSSAERSATTDAIHALRRDLPLLHATLVPATAARQMTGQRVVAFAGIGHPQRFFATARSLGAVIAAEVPYPDHHAYTAADAARLLGRADSLRARLVSTAKDYVRLLGHPGLARLAEATFVIDVDMVAGPSSSVLLDELLWRALSQ
ncbi:MAG: tetraacyldisaccharide 4'-kinase [Hyphomicrobiaceae bacterium]|nr:tetraacyldisaccharide 4'-kinase [Hyphomicrobiaceae bacterium]